MSELRAVTAIDVTDAPADVKIRHVDMYELVSEIVGEDEVTSRFVKIRTDTPEAPYCWLVRTAVTKLYVSGDYHLPCIPPVEPKAGAKDDVVGTLTKVHPKTGEMRYGPGEVRQSQFAAWVAAGVPGVTLIEPERL